MFTFGRSFRTRCSPTIVTCQQQQQQQQHHLTQAHTYKQQHSILFSSSLKTISIDPQLVKPLPAWCSSSFSQLRNGDLNCCCSRRALVLKSRSVSPVQRYSRFKSTQALHSEATSSPSSPPPGQSTTTPESYPERILVPPGLLTKARQMAAEITNLEHQLSTGYDSKLALRAGQLEKVKQTLQDYEQSLTDLDLLLELIQEDDPLISSEAKSDYATGIITLNTHSRHLIESLVPSHQYSHLPCILEIRPGTGGSEAGIFANELLKMYLSYFHNLNWKTTTLSLSKDEGSQGSDALSEAIIHIDHPGSYDHLRLESGVHRVQRIPVTETKGRVHTSTSTVLILPSFPEDEKSLDLESIIDPKDVRIDVMRSRGAGGQHVNTTDSAVRMTHIPTGIVAAIQDSRSQHKNREKCWSVLRSRVAAKIAAEKEEEELKIRRQSLGIKGEKGGAGGGRADKLRTYNFSQNRVTDHRSGTSIHNLDGIMRGEEGVLGGLIKEVHKWRMEVEVKALEL